MTKAKQIEEARKTLRKYGYSVDNLWQVADVKGLIKGKISDEDCLSILNDALSNDATMEQIWLAIKIHAEDENFELNED